MIMRIKGIFGRVNDAALRVCVFGTVTCLAAMVVVILLQVVARYVFSSPLAWPEEISRILMVWMTFLAAPYAYRNGLFVRLESWVSRFPLRVQRKIDVGIHLLLLMLFIVFFRESLWMVMRGSVIRASSVNLSMGLVFVVMPAAFVMLISVAIEHVLVALESDGPVPPKRDAS
ncbi:MAG: TRAP transporter small permease [Candidatus Hydrogenedentota bacterium]